MRRERGFSFYEDNKDLKLGHGQDRPLRSTGVWAKGFMLRLLWCTKRLKLEYIALLLLGGIFLMGKLHFSRTLEQEWEESQQHVAMPATIPDENPNLDSFSIMLRNRAVDNQIVLTVTTYLFLDVTLNLICSWEKIGLTNYIVGALDDVVYVTLREKGYTVYPAYKRSLLGGDELKSAVKRREDFHKVNLVKEEMIVWALTDGYEVALTDTDLVWLHNPMTDLRQNYREFDFLFQTANNDDLEQYELNGGFLYVKPTKASQTAMQMLISTLMEDFTKNDQTEFRNLLCLESKHVSNTTCRDPQSGASTLMLPRYKYGKARMLADAEVSERENIVRRTYLFTLHFNSGDAAAKAKRMGSLGQWYLDEHLHCIK